MKKAVFCLANNVEHADRIVNKLQSNGFMNEDISVLYSSPEGRMQKHETASSFSEGVVEERRTNIASRKKGTLGTEKHTKAPEGATTGGTIGGIIGGSLGLLAGIGALAIPGFGPFIAAGPIVAALSGSGVGGALGLLIGGLIGMGIPEYEAKKYESGLEQGRVLISVHVNDSNQSERAQQILKQEGAKDISTSTEIAGKRSR